MGAPGPGPEELSQRVRRFVDSALRGVACRVAEVAGGAWGKKRGLG